VQGDLQYYSEKKSWSAGTDVEFFDFVPRQGPGGGRIVIDGFRCIATWQIDVATALREGEDMPRIFGRIQVVQRDGVVRWNAPGDASRILSYQFLGPSMVSENADTGATETNLTGTTELYIPMSKPLIHTPEDTALPADSFAKVIVQGMSSSDLNLGTSVVTFDAGTYYIIADCHEEHDLQFHCVDVVKVDELTSTTEGVISVGGKVHDMTLWARGAAGGASLANLTSVRIDEPAGMLQTSLRTELVTRYRYKRGSAANLNSTVGSEVRSDPFTNSKACGVIVSDKRTSTFSGAYADRIKLNLDNSVSSLRVLTRTMKPRSLESMNQIAAQYGLRSVEQITVKTDKKTRRNLADWDRRDWPYLPFKAPLQRR
jgi:hypothetical protein